jgi:hypothetical protein
MEPVEIDDNKKSQLGHLIEKFENENKSQIYEIMKQGNNIVVKNFEVENKDLYNIKCINGIICFKTINTLQCPQNNKIKDYFDQFIKDLPRQLFYVPQWKEQKSFGYVKFSCINMDSDKECINTDLFYERLGPIMTNINANINVMLSLNEEPYRKYYKNDNTSENNELNLLLKRSCGCKKNTLKHSNCDKIENFGNNTNNNLTKRKYRSLLGRMNILNQSLKSEPLLLLSKFMFENELNIPINEGLQVYYVDREKKNIIFIISFLYKDTPLMNLYIVFPMLNDDYNSYYFMIPADNSKINDDKGLKTYLEKIVPGQSNVTQSLKSKIKSKFYRLLKRTKSRFTRRIPSHKTQKQINISMKSDIGYLNFINS